jgi:hypothetical protein
LFVSEKHGPSGKAEIGAGARLGKAENRNQNRAERPRTTDYVTTGSALTALQPSPGCGAASPLSPEAGSDPPRKANPEAGAFRRWQTAHGLEFFLAEDFGSTAALVKPRKEVTKTCCNPAFAVVYLQGR